MFSVEENVYNVFIVARPFQELLSTTVECSVCVNLLEQHTLPCIDVRAANCHSGDYSSKFPPELPINFKGFLFFRCHLLLRKLVSPFSVCPCPLPVCQSFYFMIHERSHHRAPRARAPPSAVHTFCSAT